MNHRRRNDIDGLRAVAILAVLLYHSNVPIFPGGFVGVDVFFVISGYLIAGQVYQRLVEDSPSLWGLLGWFYARRILRILPGFIFISTLTAIVGYVVLLPNQLDLFARSLMYSTIFVANIYFSQRSYFDPDAASLPLLHYWSLGVEIQYYLAFPFIAFAIWKFRPQSMTVWLLVLLALSLAASEVAVSNRPGDAFYWLPFRAWELLLGAVVALPSTPAPRNVTVAALVSGLGILLVLVASLTYTDMLRFPGLMAFPPCIGAACVIWGGRLLNPVRYGLSCPLMRWIGLISYSLYLAHWPVIVFFRRQFPDTAPLQQVALTVPISFAIATFCYVCIERPILRQRLPRTRRTALVLGIAVLAVLGAGAALTVKFDGFASRAPRNVQAALDYTFDFDTAYRQGVCFLTPEQRFEDLSPECLPVSSRPVVALWGDSYAAHYVPALKPFLEGEGREFAQLNALLCAPILGRVLASRPHCKRFNDLSFAWAMDRRPELVILSAYWLGTLDDLSPLAQGIEAMQRAGIKVVVLGPGPFYRLPVPELIAQRQLAGNNSILSRDDIEPEVWRLDALVKEEALRLNLNYISIVDALCPSGQCPLMSGESFVHWDNGHLTDVGASIAIQRIAGQLNDILESAAP